MGAFWELFHIALQRYLQVNLLNWILPGHRLSSQEQLFDHLPAAPWGSYDIENKGRGLKGHTCHDQWRIQAVLCTVLYYNVLFLSPFLSRLQCLYGCYVHSSIIPTFHRRCYWLLQVRTPSSLHFSTNFSIQTFSKAWISHMILIAIKLIGRHPPLSLSPWPFLSLFPFLSWSPFPLSVPVIHFSHGIAHTSCPAAGRYLSLLKALPSLPLNSCSDGQ